MIFSDLAAGQSVFLDANLLVYHFGPHPVFGSASSKLIERFEKKELSGFTSAHVLGETAHHLMTLEAATKFGWKSKIVQRIKQAPGCINRLSLLRVAVEKVGQLGIQVVATTHELVVNAASISQQFGLLSNDALIIAVMQAYGLSNLASNDADFDRVPGITRFAPA